MPFLDNVSKCLTIVHDVREELFFFGKRLIFSLCLVAYPNGVFVQRMQFDRSALQLDVQLPNGLSCSCRGVRRASSSVLRPKSLSAANAQSICRTKLFSLQLPGFMRLRSSELIDGVSSFQCLSALFECPALSVLIRSSVGG